MPTHSPPASRAALDRGYVSAALRAALAAQGCTVHTPPKRGMVDPPAWDPKLYARRHQIENLFSSLKDWARIALRRDKTRSSWMGFAHLVATIINLRAAQSSHRPWPTPSRMPPARASRSPSWTRAILVRSPPRLPPGTAFNSRSSATTRPSAASSSCPGVGSSNAPSPGLPATDASSATMNACPKHSQASTLLSFAEN
ncbi:MAG: hypothetical protein DI601_20175 [Azospirillum brasilense]|nr:MAG: hypothetical protein DI601_20175 [Azospirillum brasilense]